MYALVIEGVVSLTSKRPKLSDTGTWLPLVEDPATFSIYGEQIPNGFTVNDDQVTRHWRQVPSTEQVIAHLEAKIASLQAVAATPEAVELAVQEERITEEQAMSLGVSITPPNDGPVIGGKL